MDRSVLSDEQWARVAPLLPGKPGDPGRSGTDNRLWLLSGFGVASLGLGNQACDESAK